MTYPEDTLTLSGNETLSEFRTKIMQHTPEAVDKALRALTGTHEYPKAFIGKYFIPIKQGVKSLENKLADEHLIKAAHCSITHRQHQVANGERQSLEDGSYMTLIIPNKEHPLESLVLLVQRSLGHGPGLGCLGGRLERDKDLNPDGSLNYLPKRELKEELLEGYQLDPQEKARLKTELKEILDLLELQPLFTSRDDAHFIDRGWGFNFNAHAHLGSIPEQLQQKALSLFTELSKKQTVNHNETSGIKLIPLGELHEHLPEFHYPHEAFATSVAATIALAKMNFQGMAEDTITVASRRSWLDVLLMRHPTHQEEADGSVIDRGPPTALETASIPYQTPMDKELNTLKPYYEEIVDAALSGELAAPGKPPLIEVGANAYLNKFMFEDRKFALKRVGDKIIYPDQILVRSKDHVGSVLLPGDSIKIGTDGRLELSNGAILTQPVFVTDACMNGEKLPVDPRKCKLTLREDGTFSTNPADYVLMQPSATISEGENAGRINPDRVRGV